MIKNLKSTNQATKPRREIEALLRGKATWRRVKGRSSRYQKSSNHGKTARKKGLRKEIKRIVGEGIIKGSGLVKELDEIVEKTLTSLEEEYG